MIHVNVPEMVIKKTYFCTFEGEKLPILNFNAPWKFSHGTLKITPIEDGGKTSRNFGSMLRV